MARSETSAPKRPGGVQHEPGHRLLHYWYHIHFSDEEVKRGRVELFVHRFKRFYQTLGRPEGMVLYRVPGSQDYYFSCGPFEYAGRIYREFPAERLEHPPTGQLETVFVASNG
jgi:hypothetical protein